ncbi:bifunctional UDP-N-acetylglucosamine diphosphorylase/glucosamine-1-phosphate N-acetyltransferase GlmU [Labrys sp. KNU-23]|uniref:bifunctional UDP-N-acetylglucosamine diphosphorylase/glucosamine-1-phosphate N-acetyltransferase GlmU n=1 Tax=Labrys sp. KNU-23 TaxID=2789216 RepID=UPI0011F05989|nr:bifunctional UDP-N-acetylglucosamine diphosphorylase/glucosamine-1-phosphate N-acetyltransferase GlmU [Labrys sp. KNU-23]QEN87675.1 bifunctional UDP-N-acetylglucosamine diphosphorylase/glucosamine-1-phosphate N-acetyltransferase GlmU [Labrys sp. KNU-23]
MSRPTLAVILAAGEGTRMKSSLPKVLHAIAGRSMLAHVLASVKQAGITDAAVVVGPGREDVARLAQKELPGCAVFTQVERKGTGHAVLAAKEALADGKDIIVLYADTPLVRPQSIETLKAALADGASVAVLGFHAADPTGYGRLIVEGDALTAIVEEKDATSEQKAVGFCNGGLMALRGENGLALLEAIGNDNAKGEYYLTDAAEIAHRQGLRAVARPIAEEEVQGVNDRLQLAAAEAVMQSRLRTVAMREGVTMTAPETVFLSHDTRIGNDVVIEPNCWFGPGVTIESGAVIHAFSHLEGAHVGSGASVGPFARLRPGANLAEEVKVGNFVEVKAASVERGAKISHLSYIGDARVGAEANIGAGTITCNYDGYLKHRTDIGAGVFVGSNSALVAPVTIGDNANIGAGSVITRDVPADALAVARGRQVGIDGWAKVYRTKKKAEKEAKSKG